MTQFHDWEWFTGEVPTGRVQTWVDGDTRERAESSHVWRGTSFDWANKIAFRRVKEPVRGEVVLTGWCYDNGDGVVFGRGVKSNITHRLTLPTEDGALICGEYVGPGGAVVKVVSLAIRMTAHD